MNATVRDVLRSVNSKVDDFRYNSRQPIWAAVLPAWYGRTKSMTGLKIFETVLKVLKTNFPSGARMPRVTDVFAVGKIYQPHHTPNRVNSNKIQNNWWKFDAAWPPGFYYGVRGIGIIQAARCGLQYKRHPFPRQSLFGQLPASRTIRQ